ncbi:hypothetical protein [Adhaeribacter pallidiroseus]|uniref:Cell wall protein DAN4 n=1 Tax=Adhaeribacter pallidiroseus TaxID=2072847 RepID=A0A369QL21_9BACT|nr:hypothetical protein [Adhaeribacter pallidiroseus]RDC65623.1 Cell wall protein DAN4 [Adhaeribacter pallidiroseus]
MKKIVVSAFSLFLLGAVSANAQTTTGGQSGTATQTTTPSTTPGTTQSGTQTGTASGTQEGTAAGTTTTPGTSATGVGTGAATGTAATGAAGTAAGTAATPAAPAGTTVALEELPAPVKATLASEKLKTWTPSAAQLVTDATTGKEYYSIELKQANQIGTVKLGKDGKPVK